MQARLQLLHSWQRQLHTLLPGVRITQVRGLGTLVVGILLARTVRLPAVAATLPGAAGDESRIRRLRRQSLRQSRPAVNVVDNLVTTSTSGRWCP